ncbi:glycosyltransferase [Nitrospira sp. Kam-Ns4a]
MRVSVVVPALNEERVLADTLRRALSLGFDEVIVVDGGSRDGTRAVAESALAGAPGR